MTTGINGRRFDGRKGGTGMSSAPPVFVLGAPRSGTTLLYHMLLSAGGFAYFRAETHAYSLVGPRFGWLKSPQQRAEFWEFARHGYLFERSGIPQELAQTLVLNRASDVGSFLDGFMSAICDAQGVMRWAECTPDHALFIDDIARDFPDARFIHMLRDGRNVALSLARQEWIQRLPMNSMPPEVAAGFYWEWLAQRARAGGGRLDGRFLEIRFEELVSDPRGTLEKIGPFLGAELDYDTILERGVGSVSRPNTSYPGASDASPLERWRSASPEVRAHLQAALGPALEEFGYASDSEAVPVSGMHRTWRSAYRTAFGAKHRIRARSPLGRRFVNAQLLAETDLS
jgi:hypothetical protein